MLDVLFKACRVQSKYKIFIGEPLLLLNPAWSVSYIAQRAHPLGGGGLLSAPHSGADMSDGERMH